jgi:hypothetical protein
VLRSAGTIGVSLEGEAADRAGQVDEMDEIKLQQGAGR